MDETLQKFHVLPVQLIDIEEGVLLKRGCTVLKIHGEGAKSAVQTVISVLSTAPSTRREVVEAFSAPEREAATQLFNMLMAKRLVTPWEPLDIITSDAMLEDSLDIFYWHFGLTTAQVSSQVSRYRITILGVNSISLRLFASLQESKATRIEIVDHPQMRNFRFFDGEGRAIPESLSPFLNEPPREFHDWLQDTDPECLDCLVVTSDFGGQTIFREWNQFCLEHHIHFFPISLRNLIGYVGPLMIPPHTACFDCVLARENSHQDSERRDKQIIDDQAFNGQGVVGFHPAMAGILGEVGAMELTKFYGGKIPGWRVGAMIEVNLLTSHMTPRKVLKIPRCLSCSSLKTTPSINPKKDFMLTANKTVPSKTFQ